MADRIVSPEPRLALLIESRPTVARRGPARKKGIDLMKDVGSDFRSPEFHAVVVENTILQAAVTAASEIVRGGLGPTISDKVRGRILGGGD